MQSYTSVDYDRSLDIRNLDQLPKGTGANYLLCALGENENVLLAKSWHRKFPKRKCGEVVVVFPSRNVLRFPE